MLSLRARIFIIISLIVLVILGISIFLFVRAKKLTAAKNLAATTEGIPTATDYSSADIAAVPVANITNNLSVNPASSLETQQNAVQQISKIFFERFNSYSSESQYQNVRDVQALVSKSYWNQLSTKLPAGTTIKNSVTPFSSSITKAYSSKLSMWNQNNATVDLQVKTTEEKNGVVTNRDQQAKVFLVKEDGSWLVNSFELVK